MDDSSLPTNTTMNDLLYKSCGRPMKDRKETVAAMHCLTGSSNDNDDPPRPAIANVYGTGPLVLSDIPESCRNQDTGGIVLGIDEAGRGSVIGPMLYGMSFWHTSVEDQIPSDFNDSKQLTEQKREQLYETILKHKDIGFGTRVLQASEISRNMLRETPYNLNAMSHDAAIALIRSLVDTKQVNIQTCYIDTVGNPASYKRRLESEFPGLEFVVESKADDNYAPCSAASIVAKVVRDRMLSHWTFSEPVLSETTSTKFGSGYPSDPTCKAWMKDNLSHAVFGFADAVRFSWGPAKKQLLADAAPVRFAADDQAEEDGDDEGEKHKILLGKKRQQEQMSAFLTGKAKPKRLPYFARRKLQAVTQL